MRLLSKIQKNIILLLLTSISFVLLTFYMNDRSKSDSPLQIVCILDRKWIEKQKNL